MVKLIYSAITSLDGHIVDADGNFDWAVPDEEVHAFINDLERPIGAYLYGRRMYEVMVGWETADTRADHRPGMQDFAQLWRVADKIVYSTTLTTVSSARTRIERDFDPEAVRQLKDHARRDMTVGGPTLAAQALVAGLVDECQLFIAPSMVGGGQRSLPDDVRLQLELLDERRFGNGTVYLRYRVAKYSDGAAASGRRIGLWLQHAVAHHGNHCDARLLVDVSSQTPVRPFVTYSRRLARRRAPGGCRAPVRLPARRAVRVRLAAPPRGRRRSALQR